jgi:hypothetical protein
VALPHVADGTSANQFDNPAVIVRRVHLGSQLCRPDRAPARLVLDDGSHHAAVLDDGRDKHRMQKRPHSGLRNQLVQFDL